MTKFWHFAWKRVYPCPVENQGISIIQEFCWCLHFLKQSQQNYFKKTTTFIELTCKITQFAQDESFLGSTKFETKSSDTTDSNWQRTKGQSKEKARQKKLKIRQGRSPVVSKQLHVTKELWTLSKKDGI